MPCDYPLRCAHWDGERRRCSLNWEEVGPDEDPCGEHQLMIDYAAAGELARAVARGDWDEAQAIARSPFVSWAER